MENYQFWALIGMLTAGFGWIVVRFDKKFDHVEKRLNDIDKRITIVETILNMFGVIAKDKKPPY